VNARVKAHKVKVQMPILSYLLYTHMPMSAIDLVRMW